MSTLVLQVAAIVAAYLLGSVNSAILVSRAMQLPDPRTEGSGNPGATNVLRGGNKTAAAVTLLGDLLKGLVPVILADAMTGSTWLVSAVALAALLGHVYPVYHRFRGGKGVATTFGVLLGMNWMLGVLWAITWLAAALLFRYASVSALVATPVTLGFALRFWWDDFWTTGVLAVITVLVFWRHASNIRDLASGKEEKIGER